MPACSPYANITKPERHGLHYFVTQLGQPIHCARHDRNSNKTSETRMRLANVQLPPTYMAQVSTISTNLIHQMSLHAYQESKKRLSQ